MSSYEGTKGSYGTNIDKTTYCAADIAFTPGAAPTDIFTITGSNTKLVRILRTGIATTQTAAGVNAWFIAKRSTANAGGTSAAVPAVPNDPINAAASATVLQYTANPVTGVLVGNIWSGWVNSPAINTAGIGGLQGVVLDFIDLFGQPITLRGNNQVLAWNFNGAALPAGLSVLSFVQWTEE